MLVLEKRAFTLKVGSFKSAHSLALANRTHYRTKCHILVYFSSFVVSDWRVRVGRISEYS